MGTVSNFKLSLIIDSIIKLCIAIVLVVAATTRQEYSFYNFLRWLVMGTAIYFAYRSYSKKQIGLVICFSVIAILFNPFQKVWFQKNTWHLIDFIVAGIIVLTIFYDWWNRKRDEQLLLKPQQPSIIRKVTREN